MTRQKDTLDARAAANEWAAEHNLPPSGGYSGKWYQDGYLGGWWPGGWPKWWAAYGIAPGSIIGGLIVAHQYGSSPVDMDMMLESEIVTHSEVDDVLIPDDYVAKFSLKDNRDVQGLIDSYEGVIRTARDIAFAQGEGAGLDCEARLQKVRDAVGT